MILLMTVYLVVIAALLLIGAFLYICKVLIKALPYIIVIAGIISLMFGTAWLITKLIT